MKYLFTFLIFALTSPAFAVIWTYQVNVNNNPGAVRTLDSTRKTFEAGNHYCEVTPVVVSNQTEFRSLACAVGTGTVSTGGLCTRRTAKTASVQYAILNLNDPKNVINIVVACKFE